MTTLALRIYKNEIDSNRLNFIRRTFTVFEESEKVLSVEGSEEDIVKLYDNCLLSDERFKQAFPEYMTQAERVEYTNKKCESIRAYFRDTLCDIIANGEETEEFARFRSIYLDNLRKQ